MGGYVVVKMKKKIYLILVVGFLLIGSIVAVSNFSNFQDAYDDWVSSKSTYDSKISSIKPTMKWITDKECWIDENGRPLCRGCFNVSYTYEKKNYDFSNCMRLEEGYTQEEDDALALEYIINKIEASHPMEEIIYTGREMEEDSISNS